MMSLLTRAAAIPTAIVTVRAPMVLAPPRRASYVCRERRDAETPATGVTTELAVKRE